jgi:hypothetical protein
MANGVPLLARDRGALPQTLEEAGLLFTIPERRTPAEWSDGATREPVSSAIPIPTATRLFK